MSRSTISSSESVAEALDDSDVDAGGDCGSAPFSLLARTWRFFSRCLKRCIDQANDMVTRSSIGQRPASVST